MEKRKLQNQKKRPLLKVQEFCLRQSKLFQLLWNALNKAEVKI